MAINVNGFDGMVNAHTRFSKGGSGNFLPEMRRRDKTIRI